MNRGRAIMWAVLGGGVLLGGGWWTYQRQVLTPRSELRAEIETLDVRIERADRLVRERMGEIRELDEIASMTIARETEEVVHELRVRLADMAERIGLRDVSIGTRAQGGVRNPAAGTNGASELRSREVRERADYFVVSGSVSGRGSLAEVLSMLGMLHGESVLWRVESVSVSPTRDRSMLDLTVELATLYMPDVARRGGTVETGSMPDRIAALVDKLSDRHLFTAPPEPVRVAERPVERPSPPSPPPADPASRVENWVVMGIVDGGSGAELWLQMRGSGAMRRIAVGEEFLGIRFGRVGDGKAMIEAGGDRYWLVVGDSLAARDSPAGGD